MRLARNYRSSGTIVTASAQVINAREQKPLADMVRDMHERIAIETAPGERAEAASVVETIERMIGGVSFFALDSGRSSGATEQDLAFSDFAVLYRTDAQSAALVDAFERSGIPYKKNSHGALADEPAVRALLQMLDESVGGNEVSERLRRALSSKSSGQLAGPAADDFRQEEPNDDHHHHRL